MYAAISSKALPLVIISSVSRTRPDSTTDGPARLAAPAAGPTPGTGCQFLPPGAWAERAAPRKRIRIRRSIGPHQVRSGSHRADYQFPDDPVMLDPGDRDARIRQGGLGNGHGARSSYKLPTRYGFVPCSCSARDSCRSRLQTVLHARQPCLRRAPKRPFPAPTPWRSRARIRAASCAKSGAHCHLAAQARINIKLLHCCATV